MGTFVTATCSVEVPHSPLKPIDGRCLRSLPGSLSGTRWGHFRSPNGSYWNPWWPHFGVIFIGPTCRYFTGPPPLFGSLVGRWGDTVRDWHDQGPSDTKLSTLWDSFRVPFWTCSTTLCQTNVILKDQGGVHGFRIPCWGHGLALVYQFWELEGPRSLRYQIVETFGLV